jgi:acetyltransferase-like isoleucine patch superfamily enzyme
VEQYTMRRTLISALIALSLSAGAFAAEDIHKVNGTASVDAGQHAGDVSTVNGSVRIGDKAVVEKASTVNGSVELGDGATANEVHTVNGGVSLGENAQVSGELENVNGRVKLEKGAGVKGHLTNVNGDISLDHAHVGGGIETVNANITVGDSSKVEGGILVKKPKMSWNSSDSRPPTIIIGPHAVVTGTMTFEREVQLYVSDSATVGKIEGATAKKFSGSAP